MSGQENEVFAHSPAPLGPSNIWVKSFFHELGLHLAPPCGNHATEYVFPGEGAASHC